MKKIEAIIRPSKLSELKAALDENQIRGLTVYDVRGRGLQRGQTQYYRGKAHAVTFILRSKWR